MIFRLLRALRHGPLRRLNPFWISLGLAYRRALTASGLPISVRHKIGPYGPFRLDGYFAFSDFAHWGSAHNEGFAAFVEACRGQRCIIDVGAHIGLVSLPAASAMAPDGVVVAFEPGKVNRSYLQRHIVLNGLVARIRVEPSLVGAEERQSVAFFELDDATGLNTTAQGTLSSATHRTDVAQTTLDSYCARHKLAPEVIKIDVEGAEIGVLEGARSILAEHRPLVLLSVHPRQIATLGHSTDELLQLLDSVGYGCRHIDGSPVTAFALREYWLAPKGNVGARG